ncbi:MAG: hypothetical protein EPN97_14825 [Alphaproteobacteria bacterium]|nr:MAG: hypothetical protein EPN97_14825 [Alphaproteobacteria bacterium]
MNAVNGQTPKPRRGLKRLTAIFFSAAMVIGMGGCNPFAEEQKTPAPVTVAQTMPAPPPQPVAQAKPPAPVCEADTFTAQHTTRELTAGEAAIVKDLFGGMLKTDCVRMNFFNNKKNGTANVAAGEKYQAEFYGKDGASADFSQEKDARKFGLFIRHMTYLWQNQTEGKLTFGEVNEMLYPLEPQYVFASYSRLQQAAIMEDYALRFLHHTRKSRWLVQVSGGDKSNTDPRLQALVEGTFASAKTLRAAFANIESRDLTTGEEALLRAIFGTALNTTGLKQSFHPESYKDIVGSASSGAAAEYWGPSQKSADFSKERDADRFGTFIHENLHVWQFQTRWRYSPRFEEDEIEDPKDPEKAYRYPLDAKFKFTDYGVEQQAAIIEDYARYYLHPGKTLWYLPKVYGWGAPLQARLPLLQKVVENQFPSAKAARESFERTGTLPKAKVAAAPKAAKSPVAPG